MKGLCSASLVMIYKIYTYIVYEICKEISLHIIYRYVVCINEKRGYPRESRGRTEFLFSFTQLHHPRHNVDRGTWKKMSGYFFFFLLLPRILPFYTRQLSSTTTETPTAYIMLYRILYYYDCYMTIIRRRIYFEELTVPIYW